MRVVARMSLSFVFLALKHEFLLPPAAAAAVATAGRCLGASCLGDTEAVWLAHAEEICHCLALKLSALSLLAAAVVLEGEAVNNHRNLLFYWCEEAGAPLLLLLPTFCLPDHVAVVGGGGGRRRRWRLVGVVGGAVDLERPLEELGVRGPLREGIIVDLEFPLATGILTYICV